MHWLFVVKEDVIKCFPFQMNSKVVSLVTCMEEIYLRCTYEVLLLVETAKHENSQQDASSFPVTWKAMTVSGVCERKSYCE